MYVAATRARERLILSGVFKPAAPRARGRAKTNDTAPAPVPARSSWRAAGTARPGSVELPPPEPAVAEHAQVAAGRAAGVGQRARRRAGRRSSPRAAPGRAGPVAAGRGAPAAADPGRAPIARAARPPLVLGARRLQALRLPLLRRARRWASAAGLRGQRPPTDAEPETRGRRAPADDELVDPHADDGRAPRRRRPRWRWGTPSTPRSSGARGRAGRHPGDERVRALLAREGVADAEDAARARTALIDGWLGSDLRRELDGDARCAPRRRSCCRSPGTVLRGNMDLLGERRRSRVVVDYKTDRVGTRRARPTLGERYAAQRAVYALAAAGGEARTVRAAHVFLERPDEPGGRGVRRRARSRLRAAAARGADRADPRGRRSSRPRALRRALLRLPGGAAPVPPARRGGPAATRPRRCDEPARRLRLRLAGEPREHRRDARPRRGATGPGPARGLAAAAGRSSATTRAPRRGSRRSRATRSTTASASTSSARPDAPEDEWPNGGLIEMTAAELERLDLRELRYDRVEVTGDVRAGGAGRLRRGRSRTWRSRRTSRPHPPPRSVVLASYLRACEAAFEELGAGRAGAFARTRSRRPVPVVEARLVRDEIPEGNPRAW